MIPWIPLSDRQLERSLIFLSQGQMTVQCSGSNYCMPQTSKVLNSFSHIVLQLSIYFELRSIGEQDVRIELQTTSSTRSTFATAQALFDYLTLSGYILYFKLCSTFRNDETIFSRSILYGINSLVKNLEVIILLIMIRQYVIYTYFFLNQIYFNLCQVPTIEIQREIIHRRNSIA